MNDKTMAIMRILIKNMTNCISNMEAEMQQVNKWISLENELPDRLTPVLIYLQIEGSIYVAGFCERIDCKNWHFLPQSNIQHDMSFSHASHWMPIPNGPYE